MREGTMKRRTNHNLIAIVASTKAKTIGLIVEHPTAQTASLALKNQDPRHECFKDFTWNHIP